MTPSKNDLDFLDSALSELLNIVFGNDDVKPKADPVIWTCHFCGATVRLKQKVDAGKHMSKCPNNPYK